LFGADGSQWDAHFPLVVATIICYFRCQGASPDVKSAIERYYSMMYNGYTDVQGWLFNLVGQPSGHCNTTTDNSLGHVIMMSYHAWRLGMTVEQFRALVLFYCCGDDLIWSDRSGSFSPSDLSETYNDFLVSIEFESLEPSEDVAFVGTRIKTREYNGLRFTGYSNRADKMTATCSWKKKGNTNLDHLQKLCSVAQCMFMDDITFPILRDMCHRYYASCVSEGKLAANDSRALGNLASLSPDSLMRRYFGWEHFYPDRNAGVRGV